MKEILQRYTLQLFGFLLLITFGCSSSDGDYEDIKVSPVVVDLTQVPYATLSEYKFFDGLLKNQKPAYGVLPYQPASELFTDYADKKRFLWLPKGTKATYNEAGKIIEFPIGSALIKTFYYSNSQPTNTARLIETRVMIKKQTGWIYAEYVWNETQTEAVYQMGGSTLPISWKNASGELKSATYRIPSKQECATCHTVSNNNTPIGIKPQNINFELNYDGMSKNQLAKLIEFGYLENNLPTTITSTVNYKDTSKSLNLRVRSYFDSNCAHCHQDGGHASAYILRFAFDKTNSSPNLGICLPASHAVPGNPATTLVKPFDTNRSLLFYRVTTNDLNYRMPYLGRTIRDEESIVLISEWINSLTGCE
jgi:uncharacterized repeat protein (TIGR03806 family)